MEDKDKTKEQLIDELVEMRQRLAEAGKVATERRQAEEILRHERDNLIRILEALEAMEDGVCIINQQYDIEYLNLTLEAQFGPPEGRKCYEYFHDRKEGCPWCQNQDVFAGKTARWEWYFFKNQKTYDLIDTPLKNPDGSISKLGILHDITERKQMEKALKEKRDRAQKYLDVTGVMFVVIDANQKVSLINKKGCEILGCKGEEIVGKNWFDNFLPERVRDEVAAVFDKLMAGEIEPVKYLQNPVLTKPEGETLIAWRNTILTNETGTIVGVLSSGEDVTERQLLWQKMVEYEELSKLKGDLLSAVSHELRTPLAIIKGYSTMLLDYDRRLSPEEKGEHLQSIDRATDRLTDLVDRLLDVSRLEAGLLRLEKIPARISKVIEEAVAEAQLRAPRHSIVAHLGKRLPMVNIDAKRIREILDNLIDNACKYSGEETEVAVWAEMKAREIEVSVIDHGRGIPAANIDRVFDRMYRIEQRLGQDPGGMGLGLALCKGLVEAHGGRIWVESDEGSGSSFFFTLPLDTKEGNSNGEGE